jgi:RimJ/RimL family protein N-acetyltransferase
VSCHRQLRPRGPADPYLRGLEREDAAAIAMATHDPEVLRWTVMPRRVSTAEAGAWIENVIQRESRGDLVAFAIVAAHLGFSGYAAVKVTDARSQTGEIFYWLLPQARGQGIGTRALNLLSQYVFADLGLARAEILIDPANRRSRQLARRCGYQYEGTLRAKRVVRGERRDLALYARLR